MNLKFFNIIATGNTDIEVATGLGHQMRTFKDKNPSCEITDIKGIILKKTNGKMTAKMPIAYQSKKLSA